MYDIDFVKYVSKKSTMLVNVTLNNDSRFVSSLLRQMKP